MRAAVVGMKHYLLQKIRDFQVRCHTDFHLLIGSLLQNDQVQLLDTCRQHHKFTRLRHSMDVAYISYIIARILRFDSHSVARAALLHDLFFHEEGQGSASLLRSHPRIALENAKKICALNPIEEDIILRHMFLLTIRPPRYKEGYIVTLVDKICATREFVYSLFTRQKLCAAKFSV